MVRELDWEGLTHGDAHREFELLRGSVGAEAGIWVLKRILGRGGFVKSRCFDCGQVVNGRGGE